MSEEEGPFASGPRLSGRAQGERARSEQEKQTIDLEIAETISAAAHRVLRGPYESFIATANRLGWSDPTINALVHQNAAQLRETLVGPRVAVCAEMRAWATSGFHGLPPGGKSLKEATEPRNTQPVQGNLEELLRPYEDPAARAIVQRTTALRERLREQERTNEAFSRAEFHMELALGEKPSRFAAQQLAPVIGKGRTAAGTTFVIRPSVAQRVSEAPVGTKCKSQFRKATAGTASASVSAKVPARTPPACARGPWRPSSSLHHRTCAGHGCGSATAGP